MKSTFILLLFFILLFLPSCKDEPVTPQPETNLLLRVEDVSCTEAWLKLTSTNLQLPTSLDLLKDDNIIKTINLQTTDTLLFIDSLLPNQTYKFQSVIQSINHSSNEVSVATMDTTSHNFTWQTFEFGTIGSSVLYDVAIIDENNIWAVGEIMIADTSANGYTIYNAVHWDGNGWELKRIMFYTICGQQSSQNAYPASSIIAFSENEIWIAQRGDQVAKIENGVQTQTFCMPWTFSINKICGSSGNDLYVVGNNGNIAHYNGSQWRKIESGTDVKLRDIYGAPDGRTVWVSGYEDFKPTVLLKISNLVVETVFNSRDYLFVFDPEHLSGGIGSVWTNNNNFVYITTWYSLYRKSIYIEPSKEEALRSGSPVIFFGNMSRATDNNNIFTIGSRNIVHHYNGVTFRTYSEPNDENITYYGLNVKPNMSVLCGQKYENGINDKAIITVIK